MISSHELAGRKSCPDIKEYGIFTAPQP